MTEQEVFKLAYEVASDGIAEKYGCNPSQMAVRLTAIARTESTFRPEAKNRNSTARGLMQILICTQREVEKKHAKVDFAPASYSCKVYPTATVSAEEDRMYNPNYAMFIAAHYLGYQYRRYKGDWDRTVHAYNQGSYPGSRKKDGQNYLAKVTKNTNRDYLIAAIVDSKQKVVKEYY